MIYCCRISSKSTTFDPFLKVFQQNPQIKWQNAWPFETLDFHLSRALHYLGQSLPDFMPVGLWKKHVFQQRNSPGGQIFFGKLMYQV